MNLADTHTAVMVLNRNMRDMTEALIKKIRKTCTPPMTIFSLEAASDRDQVAVGGDVVVCFEENRRWAWSFAEGMNIACTMAFNEHVDWVRDGSPVGGWNILKSPLVVPEPTHFWLLTNDTQLEDADTLKILLENMPDDACQIHPFQRTHPAGSHQGYQAHPGQDYDWSHVYHNVAFVEFVCPLITRKFYDQCIANFKTGPVGPHFPYGWGVDYEMAYFGHQLKLKSYICDAVGITHHPSTTHLAHEQAKVEPKGEMWVAARNSMLDVLEQRYGRNWGEIFANSARAAGVDPAAFLEWSHHDRALAMRGARV